MLPFQITEEKIENAGQTKFIKSLRKKRNILQVTTFKHLYVLRIHKNTMIYYRSNFISTIYFQFSHLLTNRSLCMYVVYIFSIDFGWNIQRRDKSFYSQRVIFFSATHYKNIWMKLHEANNIKQRSLNKNKFRKAVYVLFQAKNSRICIKFWIFDERINFSVSIF